MTATRLYFAGAGTSAITPSFNGLWASTGSAVVRPLWTSAQLSAGVTNNTTTQINETSSTSPFDRLCRQHASDSQVATAHTISGTFSMVIPAQESSTNLNGFLQVTISVWDSTGTTKRGDLYAGTTNTTESATVGAINEEITTGTMATRIIPSGTALTSVAASVGDRIVVEFGFRACNTSSSSMGALFRINDTPAAAGGDYALTSGNTATNARPWIEFTDDIFATSTAYTGTASQTVTISTSSAAKLGRSGGTAKTVTIAATSAARLGLVGGAAKTVTAATASAGLRATFGTAARTVTATATSAGIRGKLGGAARTVTIAATAAARLGAVGAATKTITVTTSSGGIVGGNMPGSAAKTITISSVSAARLGRSGGATKALTITPTAAGVRGKVATATKTLTIATTAAGTRATTTGATNVIAVTTIAGGTVTKTGPTITYWDGDTAQVATLLGYWDGSAVQPATTLGWWDGDTVQPLA